MNPDADRTTPEGAPLAGRRFADAAALEVWLEAHHDAEPELWVALPKKGVAVPSVSRHEAVGVALCFGWIDGLARSRECPDGWWLQRLTPRRRRSAWSKINRVRAEKMLAAGAMRPAGLAQVEAARTDGRWEAAYDSPSRAERPAELVAALAAVPGATEAFGALGAGPQYAEIVALQRMRRTDTRRRRAEALAARLGTGARCAAPEDPAGGE